MQAINKLRFLTLAAAILCLPAIAHAQYAYDIVPIDGTPAAINNQGQVVGEIYSAQYGQFHAYEYSNGQTTDLFPADPNGSSASGINDKGQICGTNGVTGPFVYDSATGATQTLGLPHKYYPITYANAINQSGEVAGEYGGGGGPVHAFLYSSGTGQFHDINQLGGYSTADAINNLGQAAGTTTIGNQTNSQDSAFVYSNGVTQAIGLLPGGESIEVKGINDSGDVIGYSDGTGFSSHAFLYHNGKMLDLSAALGPSSSFADGINNAGDVVGEAGIGGFLYRNGTAQSLNSLIDPSLGWNIREGVAINNAGQIVGFGNLGGFIMTPHLAAVPAPSSLLTFGLGTGVMLLAARFRKRSAAFRP